MEAIKNRYEFAFFLSVKYANPNGDPDMGNLPRMNPRTEMGFMTDASIKRRIRDYVELVYGGNPGMGLCMESGCNINRKIAEAVEATGGSTKSKDKKVKVSSRVKACEMFYDVRTFGAVLSTGPNIGQIRGPVQISMAESVDPIEPIDLAITRMCVAGGSKECDTVADYKAWEDSEKNEERTMGRKAIIPFGLYKCTGYISANMAAQTGFSEGDLNVLFEAITQMYDQCRTSSKDSVHMVGPLMIFKHVGNDPNNPVQFENESRLGRAPAHKTLGLISVNRKFDVEVGSDYRDYNLTVNVSGRPNGVEVGFMMPYDGGRIVWNQQPDDDWVKVI